METTFLNALRAFRTCDGAMRHDVLAFAGGALEPQYHEAANLLTIGSDCTTIEASLGGRYDLIHILFERCAYRLLPLLVGRRPTPVVYGKGYDMGGMYRLNEGLRWQADESMLAAADGVTFTTPDLARGYTLPSGRTTVLRKAADVAPFSAIPAPDDSTPLRIACKACCTRLPDSWMRRVAPSSVLWRPIQAKVLRMGSPDTMQPFSAAPTRLCRPTSAQ